MTLRTVNTDPWQWCLGRLEDELPAQQFNTWIRPLRASPDEGGITLSAPNRFIRDFVEDKFVSRIAEILAEVGPHNGQVTLVVANGSAATKAGGGEPPSVAADSVLGGFDEPLQSFTL